ncbi:hypothetical protein [Nocardia sp. CY41]|uniref:hypothetical protein n=1 Tax=Nocardia sp. CY41 TaxID=2608686 RepID=UPI00135C5CF2|nr:hypothetical protein [Nocardia sp. CY41]
MLEVADPDDTDPDWKSKRADYDFRTARAARHAEFIDEARDFAHSMIEGDCDADLGGTGRI